MVFVVFTALYAELVYALLYLSLYCLVPPGLVHVHPVQIHNNLN